MHFRFCISSRPVDFRDIAATFSVPPPVMLLNASFPLRHIQSRTLDGSVSAHSASSLEIHVGSMLTYMRQVQQARTTALQMQRLRAFACRRTFRRAGRGERGHLRGCRQSCRCRAACREMHCIHPCHHPPPQQLPGPTPPGRDRRGIPAVRVRGYTRDGPGNAQCIIQTAADPVGACRLYMRANVPAELRFIVGAHSHCETLRVICCMRRFAHQNLLTDRITGKVPW